MFGKQSIRSIAAVVSLAAACAALAGTEPSQRIAAIEQELSSDSFAEREAASQRLLDDIAVSQADLLELCLSTTSPEVRRRAIAIHRSRFFASPRAAIGVTFRERGRIPMIETVHDAFPVSRDGTLRSGDIIIGAAGIRLNPIPTLATSELRPLVFSHNPYETATITIYRSFDPVAPQRVIAAFLSPDSEFSLDECPEGYEMIEVAVQLGEWGMHDNQSDMGIALLTQSWRAMLERKGLELNEPDMTVRDEGPTRNLTSRGKIAQALDIRFPFLSRAAFFPSEENPPGFRNQAVIAKQLRNIAIQQVRINPGAMPGAKAPGSDIVVEHVRTAGEDQGQPAAHEASQVARQISTVQSKILELSAIATEPATPAAERRVAQDTIHELREQLRSLRDQLTNDAG